LSTYDLSQTSSINYLKDKYQESLSSLESEENVNMLTC